MSEITRHTSHASVMHVYSDLALFQSAKHENGSTSVYMPFGGNVGYMCVHDEVTPGGAYCMALIPAGVPIPNPVNTAPVPLTNVTNLCVTHNFGYFPLVQVIDSTGDVVDVDVTHTNTNQFCISSTVPVTGSIVFR